MIPVVWSLAPGSVFFSSTVTRSPARASAKALARPAKLAPTTTQSLSDRVFIVASRIYLSLCDTECAECRPEAHGCPRWLMNDGGSLIQAKRFAVVPVTE